MRWLRDLKAFWQRGRHGWAPRDTWNLDSYLARVIGETLPYLAAHSHGYPGNYKSMEEWTATLLSLAGVFRAYARCDSFDEEWRAPNAGDWDVLGKVWRDLWD